MEQSWQPDPKRPLRCPKASFSCSGEERGCVEAAITCLRLLAQAAQIYQKVPGSCIALLGVFLQHLADHAFNFIRDMSICVIHRRRAGMQSTLYAPYPGRRCTWIVSRQ